MSNPTIKKILQLRLAGIEPSIPTVWENTQSTAPNAPYQRVFFMGATPNTIGISDHAHSRLSGIMQVSLFYPTACGSKDMDERVQLIRDAFKAGMTVIDGDWQIIIPKMPAQSVAYIDGDEYISHLSIFYEAFELN